MTQNSSRAFLQAGTAVVVAGSGMGLLSGLSFLLVPVGDAIRPMGIVVFVAMLVLTTFIAGLLCLVLGWKGGTRRQRVTILLLALAPYPLFQAGLRLAQSTKEFTFAP